jgi:hypothetical protein
MKNIVRVALVALMVTKAFAQTTCLGPATGVPANLTPPHWWDNNPPQAVYYQQLDDPRWVGAGSVDFGDGTANNLEFRGLQDANYVYLSWILSHVQVDTQNNSLLYFGVPRSAADGGGTLIVKVNLKQNNPQIDQPPGAIASLDTYLRQANGTGAVLNPVPTYLTDTLRVWTNSPSANSWAVQVRIPRANLQLSGASYKMWFQVFTGLPGPAATYAWPVTQLLGQDAGFNEVYPDPANWQTMQFGTGPNDPACATGGVSITSAQMGTKNPDSHSILYGSNQTNTFFAHPLNNAQRTVNSGEIQGRFRIANWGSSPNGWEFGVDPNTLWQTIPGGSVSNLGAIPNGALSTDANGLSFNWVVTGADLAAFQNGTRLPHQCMLLELSSSGPNPLSFVNKSTWTNMNFVHASTFSDKAQITLKGLTAIAPVGRDVYVWIETLNMPEKADPNQKPPELQTTIPPTGREGGYIAGSAAVNAPPQAGKPIPVPGMTELQRMAQAGEVTQQQLEAVVPTFIVHVYHDTGKTLRFGGTERPLVTAQGSFGYYVSHEGALYGWQHDLVPQGFTLEKITTDFYKITKAPNDAVLTVLPIISALETAPSHGIPWWVWLLILILLILLWLIFRKKK